MKPETPFCGKPIASADCTDLCFVGSPTYTYLDADKQQRNTEGRPFTFEDSTLRVPFSLDCSYISDQSHRTRVLLSVFPEHILISRRKQHMLVPGFSFKTPEPLYKAFFVGRQLVCATRNAIYFLPGHFVVTKFVDIDHSQQELYILKDKTIEIYSDRKEVFDSEVEGAMLIRCTASPRTIVLATRHDVFLVDLGRKATRHLVRVCSRVVNVVYDSSGPEVSDGHYDKTAPDVCTSIYDGKTLQNALKTAEPAGGPEMLYVQSARRLMLLHMQTLRTRTVRLSHAFRMMVSGCYVVLARLQTLMFLSKDLKRFCSMQADFSAFGCNGNVLAFARDDDLTIINGRKYVFRMDSGWEYGSTLFRAGGYYKLKAAYGRADYGDDVPADTGADERSERTYMDKVARGLGRNSMVRTQVHRSRRRALGRVVCELRADLDILERRHDEVLLEHERRGQDICTAKELAEPVVPGKFALFSLVMEDYSSLYCAKQEAETADSGERLAVRRYNPSGQRRRGFT